jgi:hypothetical protein
MTAKDLGSKFVCFKCNTKFYDMKKPDPVCPKCGADQRDSPANRPVEKKSRLSAVPKTVVPVEPDEAAAPAADADEEALDFDEDEEEEEDDDEA